MDLITNLPNFEGRNDIMVIVDQITIYALFCCISHPFEATIVVTTFMEIVQKIHGIPKIIVSDRDPIFTSKFVRNIYCLGIQVAHNSSYHPQSNGRTYIMNKCL